MMRKMLLLILMMLLFLGVVYSQNNDLPYIKIEPEEIELAPGDSVYFSATYFDTARNEIDTTFTWKIKPASLGLLENSSLFIATKAGEGYIYAQLDTLIDSAFIKIEDDEIDFEKPKIKIVNSGRTLFLNDTTEFDLVYCDSLDNEIDTVATAWGIIPDSIGDFIDNNVFVAKSLGKAIVYAALDSLTDSLEIEVKTPKNFELNHTISVVPEDTVINLGSFIQYIAQIQSDGESMVTLTPDHWEIEGMNIGTFGNDGLFISENTGFGLVKALADSSIGTAFVIVEDTTNDEEINTITITRDHSNKKFNYKVITTITEGEKWKIGGMSHPLNIYNGGEVYFPVGCLSEDIRIHIDLPDFAKDKGDTVEMKGPKDKKILTAINFQVFRDDTIHVEPYYFDTPLIAGFIYKHGLLKQFNIDPLDLGLYFVTGDTSEMVVDSTGINNTVLDYYHNKIYSSVAHFSTLAIMGKTRETTNIENDEKEIIAEEFKLYQNYPNPFNPTTNIKFQLMNPGKVEMNIYNILGKKVATLVNMNYSAGMHQVQWDASNMPSGIYFIKMTANNNIAIIRTLLLK